MKLQQLKYLLAIVDNGLNITAAAERLYTSQPGVSKQLKLLEEELGLQLFTRKGKRLHYVTRAGQQVLKHARIIMSEVDEIRTIAADFYREEEGTLSVAATNTRYVLPDIICKLRTQYPGVNINLRQGTSEQIAEMIGKDEVDFTIASDCDELFGDLLRLPGYHWDRTVLVPNDHELTRLDHEITLYDLAKYPLVSYVFNFDNENSLQGTFAKHDLKANVVFTARDADIIKTYVQMGLGVGIIPGMAYEADDQHKLTALAVNGIFPRSTTWIGFRKNTVLRCYMADFIRLFAPHISAEQIETLSVSKNQQDIDHLFRDTVLPVRNGSCRNLFAAA